MLIEDEKYHQLLEDYRDLQLRVTRFSAIEQELINTRNQVDQELELYKRLQEYSSRALTTNSVDDLLRLITEALVDILELECAFVFYSDKEHPNSSILCTEGWKYQDDHKFLDQELKSIKSSFIKTGIPVIPKNELREKRILSQFSDMLFSAFDESELKFDVYFAAAVSHTKQNLYNAIEERQINIFRIFVYQMHAILASKKSNLKIKDQIQRITQSENELRKLSLIATKTKSGVIIADTFGRVEWVNNAFTQITGFKLEEIIGKKPKDFLQGEETDAEKKQLLSSALAKKEDIEIVVINRTKSGQPYYNQLEITSVFDEKGNHINFIAIQRDISEKIHHQEELLKINSRFERISNFSNTGIWDYDLVSGKIIWNDLMYQITGIKADNNPVDLREEWRKMLLPSEANTVINNIDELLNSDKSHIAQEHRLIRANDQSERIIQSLTIVERDGDGKAIRLIGSIRDITDVRYLNFNLEKALAERDASLMKLDELKNFYERILKHSPSEILVLDRELEIIFSNVDPLNPSAWNFKIGSSINEHENSIQHGVKDAIRKIKDAIQNRDLIQSEDNYLMEDGTERNYLRSILPYFNQKGDFEHAIVIGLDVSKLKKIENDVLEKNAELTKINSELDHFVYSISHDLRSPLLSIKGIISLVLQSEGLSQENIKFLNMTLSSATRLDNTIQEILEYSRNSRIKKAINEFDLAELIQNVFDDLKFSNNSNCELNIHTEGNPVVFSDKARMGVLLKNIIGNSIKYSKQNTGASIDVEFIHENDKIKVCIKDNGQGIPQKHLERVFDMFYRANSNSIGTGLGLYICKEIIKKLDGTISLTSEFEKGTEVKFEIPETQHTNENNSD